jgi:hypothetical protein
MHKIAVAVASLASLATTVHAASANIYNYCSFQVYLWPTDFDRWPSNPTVIAPGGSFSEVYHQPSNGGGVSLKLNTVPQLSVITQFEYTLTGGFIWYDGSNVDCAATACPFFPYGAYLETSDPSCPTRTCSPGQVCTGFYQYPSDDINSLACQPNADVNLYLCATSPGAPPAPSPTTTAAPAPTTTTSTPPPPPPPSTTTTAVPSASAVVQAEAPSATPSVGPKYQMEALLVGAKFKRAFGLQHAHARRHEHN